MSRYDGSPRKPIFPRRRRTTTISTTSTDTTTDADWEQRCDITAHRILRNGFTIEYLRAMTSVQIGGELDTGIVLVVSAGSKSVRNVKHTSPGITEGLKDMALDGLAGRMILYGLGFQFVPTDPYYR